MAVYLNNHWPGRVASINWGPWDTAGMVSNEVKRQFAQRGVYPIPPDAGARIFDLELRKGNKEDIEIIIGDGPWRDSAVLAESSIISDQALPLVQNLVAHTKNGDSLELVKCLDPDVDLFLKDHRLDARPVLPAAMAIELMAEAAQVGWPEWQVTAVGDIRVFKGIVLDDRSRDTRLILRDQKNVANPSNTAELEVKITDVQQPETVFYQAKVVLEKNSQAPQRYELPPNGGMDPFWTSAEGAYEKWLFHGPRFQCIKTIEGISETGMLSTLEPSSPQRCLANNASGDWLIDPIVIDSGPQLALLWARHYLDITPLPSHFQAVHIYKPLNSASSIRCHFQVLPPKAPQNVRANVFYVDPQGELLAMIEGLESVGNKALNRLAGSHLLYTDSE
jgi:hypothetical protein